MNVIEHWNSANDFVFFARRGELSSNRSEDHELSMLSLHLLQNCMVYINTLMLQQVLAQTQWADRLNPRDLHALTPLIWEHVNPYGRFELDMDSRITALNGREMAAGDKDVGNGPISDFPDSDNVIAGLTENKQPRLIAALNSFCVPENQWRITVPGKSFPMIDRTSLA